MQALCAIFVVIFAFIPVIFQGYITAWNEKAQHLTLEKEQTREGRHEDQPAKENPDKKTGCTLEQKGEKGKLSCSVNSIPWREFSVRRTGNGTEDVLDCQSKDGKLECHKHIPQLGLNVTQSDMTTLQILLENLTALDTQFHYKCEVPGYQADPCSFSADWTQTTSSASVDKFSTPLTSTPGCDSDGPEHSSHVKEWIIGILVVLLAGSVGSNVFQILKNKGILCFGRNRNEEAKIEMGRPDKISRGDLSTEAENNIKGGRVAGKKTATELRKKLGIIIQGLKGMKRQQLPLDQFGGGSMETAAEHDDQLEEAIKEAIKQLSEISDQLMADFDLAELQQPPANSADNSIPLGQIITVDTIGDTTAATDTNNPLRNPVPCSELPGSCSKTPAPCTETVSLSIANAGSSNQNVGSGFQPVTDRVAPGGASAHGAVNVPSYPVHDDPQPPGQKEKKGRHDIRAGPLIEPMPEEPQEDRPLLPAKDRQNSSGSANDARIMH